MGLHTLDWMIVLVPLAVVLVIAVRTQRYVRSVSDFLAAGRCAGRYLVCNAAGEAGMGAITVVGAFEQHYRSGFVMNWWYTLYVPVMLLMTLGGFVIYRYRQSRALTLAEFFEMRYSRRFRIFAGTLCAISGILNYAIFPAVGARFFVYFCGLPQTLSVGSWTIPTFAPVMAVLLGGSLTFTLLGGQLTAMVVDCIEGMLSVVMYVIIAVALLWMFSWSQIGEAMAAVPEKQSLLNPFDSSAVADFNLWYVLIWIVARVYGYMGWQGNQGFNCSAITPHEQKMGGVLGRWREFSKTVMIALLAVCAYTYLNHQAYASQAEQVRANLGQIDNEFVRRQMQVPVALGYLLPVGIKGMFCSIMLFALLATDSSYLHSWGSIVVQDVILPLRRKRVDLTPRQHLRWLRWSIAGVAIFAYLFSLLVPPTDYIFMYMAITGAIFTGGAGSVILGGLYWKKGTTSAAWGAMITGSAIGTGGVVLQQLWKPYLAPWLMRLWPDSTYLPAHADKFPLNGMWLLLIAMVAAVSVYVVMSLLTCRQDFDLDRLLHRGRWAVDEQGQPLPQVQKPPRSWRSLLGIDEHFTWADKLQSILLFSWSMFWFGVFVVATLWNLFDAWPTAWWSQYWYIVGILMPIGVGVVTAVWFSIGGVRDLRRLFAHLARQQRDEQDGGTVPAPAADAATDRITR